MPRKPSESTAEGVVEFSKVVSNELDILSKEREKKRDEIFREAHEKVERVNKDVDDKIKDLHKKRDAAIEKYRKQHEEKYNAKWEEVVPQTEEEFREWFTHYGAWKYLLKNNPSGEDFSRRYYRTPGRWDVKHYPSYQSDRPPMGPEHVIGEFREEIYAAENVEVMLSPGGHFINAEESIVHVYGAMWEDHQAWFAWDQDGNLVGTFTARVIKRNSVGMPTMYMLEGTINGKTFMREPGNVARRKVNPAEKWAEALAATLEG